MSFLGLSSGIVGEVSKTISGWVQNPFNRNFFYWYFFPALAFILFHQFVIRQVAFNEKPPNPIEYANRAFATPAPVAPAPAGTVPAPNGPTATPEPSNFALPQDSGSQSDYFTALLFSFLGVDLFDYVLLPFLLAVGLTALSFQITRFYEGLVPPVSWLLAPLRLRNAHRSRELYGPLFEKRLKYLELYRAERKASAAETRPATETAVAATPGAQAPAGTPAATPTAADLRQQLRDIKREIQALHEAREKKGLTEDLPNDPARAMPTALGNTLAAAEEYSFDRYGMDSVLFWPRLRAELDEQTLLPLDTAKGRLDGMLNLAVLACVAALEALGVIAFIPAALRGPDQLWRVWALVGVAVVALVLGYAAYRGAVGAASNMGAMMRSYFDNYRDKVLEKFGLKRPDKLEDEKIIWYKLGAFIRRGESFYFPEEAEAD